MYELPDGYQDELIAQLRAIDPAAFDRCIRILIEAYRENRQVFIAGNGGSAATANHFVCDFGKNATSGDKRRFRILSVCDNIAKVTAIANDLSFDEVFRHQLGNLMQPGDVLIVVSASGNSPDVVKACEYAQSIGAHIIALSGRGGGRICDFAETSFVTSLYAYERIEDLHLSILHMIVCWFAGHQEVLETDKV